MINKHVTSLELSKKLKELGCPQSSEFYWEEEKLRTVRVEDLQNGKGWTGEWSLFEKIDVQNALEDEQKIYQPNHICSAYLASEILEWLPKNWMLENESSSGFTLTLYNSRGNRIHKCFGDTFVNALAKMLIYLIENSLLKPEDLTK